MNYNKDMLMHCIDWSKKEITEKDKKIHKIFQKSSENVDDFIDRIIKTEDFELKMSEEYAIASVLAPDGKNWYRLRSMLGDNVRHTYSDAGSLKIGNEDFTILVPNGFGDGEMRYAIVDQFNSNMANPFTLIDGKFNIYTYDCGNEIAEMIEGKFYIYYHDGIVIFKRL